VDKKRHKSPLLLANYLTADNFAQNVLYGDKDCFRFAWLMLGGQQSYTLIKDKPVQMGTFRVLTAVVVGVVVFVVVVIVVVVVKVENCRSCSATGGGGGGGQLGTV